MTSSFSHGRPNRRGILLGGAALGASALVGMPTGLMAQPQRGGMLRVAVAQGAAMLIL